MCLQLKAVLGVNVGDIEAWRKKKNTSCLIAMISAGCPLFWFMVSQGGKLEEKKNRKVQIVYCSKIFLGG